MYYVQHIWSSYPLSGAENGQPCRDKQQRQNKHDDWKRSTICVENWSDVSDSIALKRKQNQNYDLWFLELLYV